MKMNITKNKLIIESNLCLKIVLAVLVLGFQQSYSQNTCDTAVPITVGVTTIPLIDGANIPSSCSNEDLAEWYIYTPTQNYSVTVTSDLVQNICKDTNFNVYTGSCSGLACYVGDDDGGIIQCNTGGSSSYLSKKTFDVTAGTTYYIVWDNKWGQTQGFDFQLTEAPYVPSPCSTAIPITAGVTTVDSIDGTNFTTSCSTATKGKWYTYTPATDVHLTITSDLIQNICKDTNFNVYTGSCSGGLTCVTSDDNSGTIACNSGNSFSNLSIKTFDALAGVTYYIAWDNKWSEAGFDFEIIEEVIIVPVHYTSQVISTVNNGSYNMCIVDMNNDGKDDIASVTSNSLRVNAQGDNGTFSFTDYPINGTSRMPGWSIAAGDLNKDGFNDLLLGSGSGLTFWISNATGTGYTNNTPPEYIFCQRTNFIDINNDGNLDAFSCHDIDPNVYYLNNGAGTYTYYQSGITAGAYSLGITASGGNYASLWTDLDNDGDQDMFISKCSGPPCEIHRNNGNGTFTDISAIAQINFQPVSSWSSAIADFDNDGDMDILVGSNGGAATRFFRNNLDTSNTTEEAYTNITAGSGWDTNNTTNRDWIAYDFDNDGNMDVLANANKIMFGNGNGTFELTNYASGINIGAVGDLNGDGFLDILNGNTVRYAVPNGNNWSAISLHGIASNSNGIGARIEIYGSWGKQIRDVRSGEGFGYMSTLNTHFGIGAATAIDQIIIRWPSGAVDTIQNPTINQRLNVVEGSTTLSSGINEGNNFSIYPNPAADQLTITPGNAMATLETAAIFDLSGRQVATPSLSNNVISVKNLSTGTYILLIKSVDGKKYTQKFLKK
ncbi:MAG: FG-GAP-like repeat-containing protein [Flavobacterium sp.]|nr:FG-GAP-like repeat-containing protein [Flavobacterium sp.]